MNAETRRPGEEMLGAAVRWWMLIGVWAVATGAVVLIWPTATVLVLALLLGFYLVVGGATMVTHNVRNRHTAPEWRWRIALGGFVVLAGAMTWLWPGVTVWALAVLFGVSVLMTGLAEVSTAMMFRTVLPGWGWMLASGAVAIGSGVLALVWPGITVFALAALMGAFLLVYGCVALAAAFRIRRATTRLRETGSASFRVDGFDVEVHDATHRHV